MKTKSISKISLTVFIGLLLFIFLIWFIPETSDSYSEPQEALLAFDKDLLLIPGNKINGDALFFFI